MGTNPNSSFTVPIHRNPRVEELIKANCTIVEYNAREKFLEYGETVDDVYYIYKGRTKHYILADDGAEKIIYTLSDGWFFGETPVMLAEPTGLISETMEPTVMWKIKYHTYQKLLDESKLFRNTIMENMSRKMLILRHEIESLVFNPCKQRIFQLLCSTIDEDDLVDNSWYNVKNHYTQYEISTLVGSARVTTSKLINELCNEGKIRILNRKIQVSKKELEKSSFFSSDM